MSEVYVRHAGDALNVALVRDDGSIHRESYLPWEQERFVATYGVEQTVPDTWTWGEFVPAPVEPPLPPVVPTSVSRFQARAALHLSGMLETVESMMAHPDTPMLAKLAWQDATEFRRDSPTVAAMAAALGLTDEVLDQLFVQAGTIQA